MKPIEWGLSRVLVMAAVLVSGCQQVNHGRFSILGTGTYYDFVFHSLVIDGYGAPPYREKPTNLGPAAGFNWDGVYSPDVATTSKCNWGDRQSDLDLDQNAGNCPPLPTCVGGVDNVLPAMADVYDALRVNASETMARAHLENELAAGHLVWLLRLENVANLVSATGVNVTLLQN